eukprot:scaffold114532_cov41-Attheya_sp.AAC.1
MSTSISFAETYSRCLEGGYGGTDLVVGGDVVDKGGVFLDTFFDVDNGGAFGHVLHDFARSSAHEGKGGNDGIGWNDSPV